MSRHFPVLVLLALCAGCSGSKALPPEEATGAAFADLRDAVAVAIVDGTRRDTAVSLVNKLERDYRQLYAKQKERRAQLRAMNADYDAGREDFIALADKLEADTRDSFSATVTSQRALRAAMTAEEWDTVRKRNTQAMQQAITALQSLR